MKERPILFSAPMVCAILEGRKTQTRRVVSRSNSTVDGWVWDRERFAALDFSEQVGKLYSDPYYRCGCIKYVPCSLDGDPTCGHRVRSCWDAGDRLWVRESFQPLLADGVDWNESDYKTGEGYAINYVATDGVAEFLDQARDESLSDRITPSIFMPRWASRITLEVTDVRVQRVQEISEADAIAEGARIHENSNCSVGAGRYMYCYEQGEHSNWELDPCTAYIKLWNKINAKRGFGWDVNPWVWAITFKRVDGGAA